MTDHAGRFEKGFYQRFSGMKSQLIANKKMSDVIRQDLDLSQEHHGKKSLSEYKIYSIVVIRALGSTRSTQAPKINHRASLMVRYGIS